MSAGRLKPVPRSPILLCAVRTSGPSMRARRWKDVGRWTIGHLGVGARRRTDDVGRGASIIGLPFYGPAPEGKAIGAAIDVTLSDLDAVALAERLLFAAIQGGTINKREISSRLAWLLRSPSEPPPAPIRRIVQIDTASVTPGGDYDDPPVDGWEVTVTTGAGPVEIFHVWKDPDVFEEEWHVEELAPREIWGRFRSMGDALMQILSPESGEIDDPAPRRIPRGGR